MLLEMFIQDLLPTPTDLWALGVIAKTRYDYEAPLIEKLRPQSLSECTGLFVAAATHTRTSKIFWLHS